jgi:hypothetical protein
MESRASWIFWSSLLLFLTVLALVDAVYLTWFDEADDAWIWAIFSWVMTPVLGWCFWYQWTAPNRWLRDRLRDQETFQRMLHEMGITKIGDD